MEKKKTTKCCIFEFGPFLCTSRNKGIQHLFIGQTWKETYSLCCTCVES